jgi:hypothetical protein
MFKRCFSQTNECCRRAERRYSIVYSVREHSIFYQQKEHRKTIFCVWFFVVYIYMLIGAYKKKYIYSKMYDVHYINIRTKNKSNSSQHPRLTLNNNNNKH